MTFAEDIQENNLTQDNTYEDIISEQLYSEDDSSVMSLSDDDSSLKSNTITIEVDKENPNQVLNPTIQPAIDAANPGDTIILKGNFECLRSNLFALPLFPHRNIWHIFKEIKEPKA